MIKIIAILILFFASLSVYAECYYSNFHIKCTIETTDGKIDTGYMKLSYCEFFPLDATTDYFIWNNFEDFKETLNQTPQWWKKIYRAEKIFKDTLSYAQNRILYKYYDTIPYYLNWKSIPFDNIQAITIEELQSMWSYMGIASELQLQDTVWLKKEPIKKVEFEIDEIGGVCSYSIFIHENSKKN